MGSQLHRLTLLGARVDLPGAVLVFQALLSAPAVAQIVPDATLPAPSQVSQQAQTFRIEGGTVAAENLFHSFDQFSVPTGSEVHFNSAPAIQRIISRVTGPQASLIDGVIRANGEADLFLINPNGLVLGENAALDIGGSFIGTTADSLIFSDGVEFSAQNPSVDPLLTVSVPTGLQFETEDPGSIQVQGPGHDFFFLTSAPDLTQLQVLPGETLALVGGDLTLTGGLVSAPEGRLELAAIDQGWVELIPESEGWRLETAQVGSFQDIQLLDQAFADASGVVMGSVQMQAQDIGFSELSVARVDGVVSLSPERVTLNATGQITLQGGTFLPEVGLLIGTGVLVGSLGEDPAGIITLKAQNLVMTEEAAIESTAVGGGRGADIQVEITDQIRLQGSEFGQTLIVAQSEGMGATGNITISTGELLALDGGGIATQANNVGDSGDVTVVADRVEVRGIVSQSGGQFGSAISTATIALGDAGDLLLHADQLIVADGGVVSASTLALGQAGGVVIVASDSVLVEGTSAADQANVIPSQISSSAIRLDPFVLELLLLPPDFVPTGDTGSVQIQTPDLQVRDGGLISVQHEGTGDAGDLQIKADRIEIETGGSLAAETAAGEGGDIQLSVRDQLLLQQQGQITALAQGAGDGGLVQINSPVVILNQGQITVNHEGSGDAGNIEVSADQLRLEQGSTLTGTTTSGLGGNIRLFVQDSLQMDQHSQISTRAEGSGSGGNIEVATDVLAAVPEGNSDIIATALTGSGGQIVITAEGIFGFEVTSRAALEAAFGPDLLEFDPVDLPSNDIIAISQADPALNGEVILNSPDVDPARGVLVVPSQLVSLEDLIASTCTPTARQSNFLITGRGGVVPNPRDLLGPTDLWVDLGPALREDTQTQDSQIASELRLAGSDPAPLHTPQLPRPMALMIQCPQSGRLSP